MAKKEKIVLQMSPDMESINNELAAAMDALDATIEQVGAVLKSFDPAANPVSSGMAALEDDGTPVQEGASAPAGSAPETGVSGSDTPAGGETPPASE